MPFKVWLCAAKPGNWKRVKRLNLLGISGRTVKWFSRIRKGDIVLVLVLSPINAITAVYKVRRPMFKTEEGWDTQVFPYSIGLRPFLNLEKNPISFGALAGIATENVEVSPYMRAIPMFELSTSVMKKIEQFATRN